uniref:Leukotriene B4 receptor n=1 Tax=Sphenodon punctatus TaxID=8508 RepID=A0A8D0GXJ2_SPHPU
MVELSAKLPPVPTASMANETSTSAPFPIPGATLSIIALSLAFGVGFPGNVFVVWTTMCRMSKRTVTSLLILHLALADLTVLLTAPFFLRLLSISRWELGDGGCRTLHYMCGVSMYASVLIIVLMSFDRCLAVSKPFVSQKIRTKRTLRQLVLAIWVMAFLLAIPVIFYRKFIPSIIHCIPYHPSHGHLAFHNLFETLTGFVLPFAAILFSYGVIGQRLQETRFRRKRRTSRLIILIVVTFALFWFPYHLTNTLDVAGALSGSEGVKNAGKSMRPLVIALAFLSSSVNPILYTFMGGSLIRSAGIGFMAKLFEGTASEMSSTRHGTGKSTQRCKEAEMMNHNDYESPEYLTTSTKDTETSREISREAGKSVDPLE